MFASGAFNQEKELYRDPNQPLGKFLPQLHSIVEGEASGLRDAHGDLMPPCIIMEQGEALDVWIMNSGDKIDMFTGLQARPRFQDTTIQPAIFESSSTFRSFTLHHA